MCNVRTLSCMLGLLFMATVAVVGSCQDLPSTGAVSNGEVIFSIGVEDKTDYEFRSSGWRGKDEYVCRPGIDYNAKNFPAELHVPGVYEDYGVVRLRVLFELTQSYKKVVLRLVRGGDETTAIVLDGEKTFAVTSTMLGSTEGFRAGSYELDLGALPDGKHSLEFTVVQDGKGNGAYQWDALKLFGI